MMSEKKSLAKEWIEFLKRLKETEQQPMTVLKEALKFVDVHVFIPQGKESTPLFYIVSPYAGELTFVFQSGVALIFKLFSFSGEETVRIDWGLRML